MTIWLRRSTAIILAPIVLGALMFTTLSTSGWQYEWLWGLRNVVGVMPLISPLVAAGVAFDIAQRWGPTMADLGPSTARWRHAALAPVFASILWTFLSLSLAWGVAASRLQANDAIGEPDAWLPLEVLAALLATAMVGFALGRHINSVAAAPLAAIVVFATSALAAPFGLNNLFSPLSLSSSAAGLSRDTGAALLHISLNLVIAALCCLVGLRSTRRTRRWSMGLAALSAAVIAIAMIPPTEYEYRPISSPEVCEEQASVTTCGPGSVQPLIRDVSRALQQARESVDGLPLPQDFVLIIPGAEVSTDERRAVVMAPPASLRGDQRVKTLADMLSVPVPCPQFFEGGDDLEPLLDRRQVVRDWLEQALRTGGSTAPRDVQAAYDDLLACQPSP